MERNRETYDELCARADAVMAKYNPCAGCLGCEAHNTTRKPLPYDCCEGCPLLGPQGCTTSCLACKLWVCDEPVYRKHNRPQAFYDEMLPIKQLAYELNLHYARATPEEVLALDASDRRSTWYFYHEGPRRGPAYHLPIQLKVKK